MKKPKIFISYGSQDRQMASLVAEQLRQGGFSVWLDVAKLTAGESIVGTISAELAKTDLILVLLSRDSVASPWCRAEYEAALTQEINTGAKRVVPVILDDVEVPALLASKKRIDLREGGKSRALSYIGYTIKDILKELPITTMIPARPKYRYSKLAMIIAGVLSELPVPSFEQEPLLEGRTLVDLYRTVERLIERFEEVCVNIASVLNEAFNGQMSYASTHGLWTTDLMSVNLKLIRIATDMREIAQELRKSVTSKSEGTHKLLAISELCTTISTNEDVVVVALSKPERLLNIENVDIHSYDFMHQVDEINETFDSSESSWGEPSIGEVRDLEQIVLDMERYRSDLRAAIARVTNPD